MAGKLLQLIFLGVLLVFVLVQFFMQNSGIIALILCLIILLPLIVKTGFSLCEDIVAKRNWNHYQKNKDNL